MRVSFNKLLGWRSVIGTMVFLAASGPLFGQELFEQRDLAPADLDRIYVKGLQYLERSQTPEGFWSDSTYGREPAVVGLAVVGVLMSVVSAYYYLRVVVAMYMREPLGEDAWARVALGPTVALTLAAVVILGLGVYPWPMVKAARAAILPERPAEAQTQR